ncbi:MAG TPA: SDR family NAD(P)-dependent oxidoreductase, partial [Chloroflexota bacterium]|nr:SDR family NAD(P)-dependent oxidoreductase [Chloroflexota bacterium]
MQRRSRSTIPLAHRRLPTPADGDRSANDSWRNGLNAQDQPLLAQRVALVVGASSGIGCAVATRFAGMGMKVALAARNAVLLGELATVLRGQ